MEESIKLNPSINIDSRSKKQTRHLLQSLPLIFGFASIFLAALDVAARKGESHVGYYLLEMWRLLMQYRLPAWCLSVAGVCGFLQQQRSSRHVYLLDFSCYKPHDEWKFNYELCEYLTRSSQSFTLPSMYFQRKIFERSGLGQETYIPPCLFDETLSPRFSDARAVANDVMFGSVDELLFKSKIKPQDISIVVTNCSLHSPSPSYAAMLVNHYKLREDCKTYHLGGMGCSASLIACKLAADLLRARPNQYALVVSTENNSLNWYSGNEKPMLVTNCLFRAGCAAMLLTNKKSERSRSKYELLHCIRTHKAADDKAFRCAYQREDGQGILGVGLNKNLMGVAADALRTNIRTLSPLILPLSQQLLFVFNLLCRQILKLKVKQYQPDFKLAVEHFCIHAGGRAVIDEIQKNLYLNDYLVEPARCTLHRWGNTSASCLWYVLAYMESKERIKAGDKVWMLGLGSGFKCNSAILKAISDIPASRFDPWADSIDRYPACIRATQHGVTL